MPRLEARLTWLLFITPRRHHHAHVATVLSRAYKRDVWHMPRPLGLFTAVDQIAHHDCLHKCSAAPTGAALSRCHHRCQRPIAAPIGAAPAANALRTQPDCHGHEPPCGSCLSAWTGTRARGSRHTPFGLATLKQCRIRRSVSRACRRGVSIVVGSSVRCHARCTSGYDVEPGSCNTQGMTPHSSTLSAGQPRL